jgi:transcriptional regulator with XRE-family HTH domain
MWQLTFEDAMAQEPNPTAHRRELAARLRQLRLAAGLSVEEVATSLMCSAAKVSRMETAGRGVQPRDIRDLSGLYGVSAEAQDELMQLAKDAKKAGWWQSYETLEERRTTFLGLENAASLVQVFEGLRIPGLFQTADFTAAFLPQMRPPGELEPAWIEDAAAARTQRQRRVQSGELVVHAIIDEAALRRMVGDRTVMQRQLERLIHDSALPNVTIQVIPFANGPHPGLDGSFNFLSFAGRRLADTVFVEGLLGDFVVDKAVQVAQYRSVFTDLSNRFALDEARSVHWLSEVVAE